MRVGRWRTMGCWRSSPGPRHWLTPGSADSPAHGRGRSWRGDASANPPLPSLRQTSRPYCAEAASTSRSPSKSTSRMATAATGSGESSGRIRTRVLYTDEPVRESGISKDDPAEFRRGAIESAVCVRGAGSARAGARRHSGERHDEERDQPNEPPSHLYRTIARQLSGRQRAREPDRGDQSKRIAVTGLRREARSAGTAHAPAATNISSRPVPTKLTGSRGDVAMS